MSDLHQRFRTLDYLPQPDLWSEIERRATAAPTRSVSGAVMSGAGGVAAPTWSVSRSTSILIVVGLLLAVLAGAALVASGALPQPVLPEPMAPQGEWDATGVMVQRRTEGHSVTRLGDGRVLVAGGERAGPDDGVTKSAELYDPTSGTWSATGDMVEARKHHSATLLPDGRVLVAGGESSIGETLASAEVYDASTGTWAAITSMRAARQAHAAALLPDGRVLIAAGQEWVPVVGGADMSGVASAEIFDPATGMWAPPTEMPTPHATDTLTATVLLDGRVLFVGASANLYDPATASWTATSSMERGRFGHTATLLRDGRVLIAGLGFPLWPDAALYDPKADSWTRTGDMNERRAWFAAGLLADGTVLAAGSGDGGYGGSPTAEVYDPATGTWMLTPNMLAEHGYHEGVPLDDGGFLVVGGFGGDVSAETYRVGGDH
jgi:hypothetical protein